MAKILKLNVELADTPSKREMGLMYRKYLPRNSGMLFKFKHASQLSFWMKHTAIPLDIAFIDDKGVIFQIEKMKPYSTEMTTSRRACKYALEVNSGWFKENGMSIGSKVINFSDEDNIKLAQIIEPEQPAQNNSEQPTNQPNQPNQIILDKSIEEMIKEAEANGVAIIISYVTEKGNTLPPRRLMPYKNKFEISNSKNGKMFTAIDVSPTISGGGMEIEGGHVKTFLIENIVGIQLETKE